MIVATVNSKGGVGKTTIAVHLADWLMLHGYSVVLVDCDAQRLSSQWLSAARPDSNVIVLEDVGQIESTLPRLGEDYDAVVVDSPGGLGEIAGAVLVQADAVFIPTGPSNLDIMALSWATTTIHAVQRLRGGLPQTVVIPVQAGRGRCTTSNLLAKAKLFGFGVTSSLLPYREIYAQVCGLGDRPPRLLWQLGKSKRVRQAALEMDALLSEIFPEACAEDPSRVGRLVSPARTIEETAHAEKQIANC